MTKDEAIEVLSSRYQVCVVDSLDATIECERWNRAVDMAIKALEGITTCPDCAYGESFGKLIYCSRNGSYWNHSGYCSKANEKED